MTGQDKKLKLHPLCPGKEMLVKDTCDLKESSFNRLVSRRARQLIKEPINKLSDKTERKKVEAQIKDYFEKIDHEPNFLPVKFLDLGAKCADAVCRVVIRNNQYIKGYGTGFLIAPGIIMTNNHVLGDIDAASTSVIEFGYEEGETLQRVTLEPDRLFITNQRLDFTIVACDKEKVKDLPHIPLLRSPATVTRNERVNIIQHPKGEMKQVVIHRNTVIRVKDKVVHYKADTLPGSSGSPVFNDQWELVALHHAGWKIDTLNAENEGIRISAIVAHLLRLFRTENEVREELHHVINAIPDYSPYLGFFDVIGIEDDEGVEVEVPDFVGSKDCMDIGFWNIEHFNNRVSQTRVNNVSEVISRLSMDIMGLTEVEKGAMDKMIANLNQRGDNMNYILLDTHGRQDIAVLYDQDTCKVEMREDIVELNRDLLDQRTVDGKTAFPRWPLFAECTVKDEGTVNEIKFIMIVVHLKAFGDAQSRARRRLAAKVLSEIIDDIRETYKLPVVLGGDFNERLDNDVLDALHKDTFDLFAMTADDAKDGSISYVGQRHRSLIDHIIISNDIVPGNISGDDAAIVRLDRTVSDFSDKISDHVPIVFRMIMRKHPIDIDPVDHPVSKLEIPEDAHYVNLQFN